MKIGVGLQGTGRHLDRLLWLNPDAVLIMPESLTDARWLRAHGWQGEVWLRWYDSNVMSLAAPDRWYEIRRWLLRENDVGIKHIIPANELNLGLEHGGLQEDWGTLARYRQIDQWLIDFDAAYRHDVGIDVIEPLIIHWPALSPGHNPEGHGPDGEYYLLEESLKLYPEIDVHVYGAVDDVWTGAGRLTHILEVIRSIVSDKPINVTEVNSVNYIDYLEYAKGLGVSTNHWFLWEGNPEHAAFDLLLKLYRGNPSWDTMRQYIEDNREGGQTMPDDLRERYPELYNAWYLAGGHTQFRRYLIAIGVLGDPFPAITKGEALDDLLALGNEIYILGQKSPNS